MLFSKYGQNLLVAHERHSRLVLATMPRDRKAARIARQMTDLLASLPAALRQTVTFDNGTEFAHHHQLTDKLGVRTFFCDPHSPWQKGGVENAIGRLRRNLPRKTNIETLTKNDLDQIICQYNNIPRKCLGYKTPAEVFRENLNLLHFNCESISPPSRG